MKENKIKEPQGKYYRYILYAQLLFAMKYYGDVHGETKLMCVDEGQDLALNEYKLIYELNRRNMVFNIFGDTNQLIKPGRGISDWNDLKEFLHAAEFKLNENYRNTNQITRFCNDSFEMDVLQTGVDGAAVREIPRRGLEDEISSMKLGTERVAILVPRSVQKKAYLQMDKISDEQKECIGDQMENGYISLMYVDEVKGIEFHRVFVVANGMSKNEKYIAYTRALSELILVIDDTIQAPEPEEKGHNKEAEKEEIQYGVQETLSLVEEAGKAFFDVSDTEEIVKVNQEPGAAELKPASLKAMKRVVGSGLSKGTYVTGDFTDDEIMDMFDGFFSSASRKDTTYKNAFFKSILDCIPKVDHDLRITFDVLFGRFTELYWPLVVNYDIQQKAGKSSRSYVEQLLLETVEIFGLSNDAIFDDLSTEQKEELIKKSETEMQGKCGWRIIWRFEAGILLF